MPDKQNADVVAILRNAELQQRLDERVVLSASASREVFDQIICSETARWAQVIKDTRIAQQ